MIKVFSFFFTALLFVYAQKQQTLVDIYLIGDSTMSTYPDNYYPRMGWGQVFHTSFKTDKVRVNNEAVSGRSTKSYIEEGLWEKVYNNLKKGDFVFIQFGHNDMVESKEHLYAPPFGAYTDNLHTLIVQAREKGAKPVLITPMCKRRFDKDGNFQVTMGQYPVAMRVLAERENVPLIDLHKLSCQKFRELGLDKTKNIFLWLSAGESAKYPEGVEDNTHFQEQGALLLSKLVAQEIKRIQLSIAPYLKEEMLNTSD